MPRCCWSVNKDVDGAVGAQHWQSYWRGSCTRLKETGSRGDLGAGWNVMELLQSIGGARYARSLILLSSAPFFFLFSPGSTGSGRSKEWGIWLGEGVSVVLGDERGFGWVLGVSYGSGLWVWGWDEGCGRWVFRLVVWVWMWGDSRLGNWIWLGWDSTDMVGLG
eukprot:TRINITY_DN5740_c1_g4_i1.p1 TRINITY_DN5740_c1_g4~~TRINITY_DN5740_c1_g4_i1.p1  ORF type:complete len:164 (-),score=31.52 TRINITY_DN5740_c1_g4_i1:568-1059(-)